MVWSDPEIVQLSKEFVTVADEVYMLYPEDPGNLQRVADNPDHVFFKRFGAQVPKTEWNHPGTKQGIYMIGPDAEYLEAKFAGNGNPRDIAARLRRALQRWATLKAEKGYAAKPIPPVKTTFPPEVADRKMILRVNLRDLPRGPGDRSGARREDMPNSDMWYDFVKWAWNENWIGFDDPSAWVTKSRTAAPVPNSVLLPLVRETLVDNVRGQAAGWSADHVKSASLTKRVLSQRGSLIEIEYSGTARMSSGGASFNPTLYGKAIYDEASKQFVKFDLLAIGPRSGRGSFNQREKDLGPAPMGVAYELVKK